MARTAVILLRVRGSSQRWEWALLVVMCVVMSAIGQRSVPQRLFGEVGPDQMGFLLAAGTGSILASLQKDRLSREGLILTRKGYAGAVGADVMLALAAAVLVVLVSLPAHQAGLPFAIAALIFGISGVLVMVASPALGPLVPWLWVPLAVVGTRSGEPWRILTLPYSTPPAGWIVALSWLAVTLGYTLSTRRRTQPSRRAGDT